MFEVTPANVQLSVAVGAVQVAVAFVPAVATVRLAGQVVNFGAAVSAAQGFVTLTVNVHFDVLPILSEAQ